MTLVELIITLSIMVIIIYIVFPKDNIQKYELDSFARQFASDIRYVRSININGNENFYLENIKSSNDSRYVIKDNSEIIKTVYLPQNSTLTSTYPIIKFKSDGTLNSIGETMTLKSAYRTIEITIIPFSGRVLLKEGKYE
ncbi:Tfp pilus assembly protein FimT/FimU [Paraclostridium bifermentans]|uniref:Tfp pilus assembly protein FimT/FimU n=2 Tax=Paraclostridium bifermentans TaxID=1490 RepID=UPI00359C101E